MLCWGGFFLFLFPSLIVKCLVYFLEVLIGDMGVDLRRDDGCVSEHRVDAPDIRAIGEEIGRESVPKRVRMDIFDDAGFGGVVLDDALDTSRCQAGYSWFLVRARGFW